MASWTTLRPLRVIGIAAAVGATAYSATAEPQPTPADDPAVADASQTEADVAEEPAGD